MSKVVKRRWQSDLGGSGLPRRDRVPCDYEAYVPDPLIGRKIVLDGDVAADVADAEAAIVSTPMLGHSLTPRRLPASSCGPRPLPRHASRGWKLEHDGSSMPRSSVG